jgi:hypothetical protein
VSADKAECGCEGHADQQVPECTYPELRHVLTMIVKRLEEEHGKSVLLSSQMQAEMLLAKAVLKGTRIPLNFECVDCWKSWGGGVVRCDCGGVVVEKLK